MSKTTKQRTTASDLDIRPQADGSAAGSLPDTRTEIDKLFAVASKSFDKMSEGDSQEFLERSRQTGGQ